MTSLHNLYPKHRAHASSRIHRRRYSPQSFVYTVLLFSLLGLAGYVYRSDTSIQRHAHPYTTLNKRQLGAFASSDEEVHILMSQSNVYLTDLCHSADSSTKPPTSAATSQNTAPMKTQASTRIFPSSTAECRTPNPSLSSFSSHGLVSCSALSA